MKHQPFNIDVSVITGKPHEAEQVNRWVYIAQLIDPTVVIGADESDESDETETCLAVVVPRSTQRERAELFATAKKVINQLEGKHHD